MKLNYVKTLKVGLAFAIICVFWSAYDYVVPLLLENAFGLSNTVRGLIMGLDNLLSLFLLPLFGKISDKTTTKFGKRTPFIFIGTLVTVALMVFVPLSANKQLKSANELRATITTTENLDEFSYTASDGNTYNAVELYTKLYKMGAENSDYCDHKYMSDNGINTLEDYLNIALNPYESDGETLTQNYKNFVKSGVSAYASDEIFECITKNNIGTIVLYMVILLLVLIAMATFRSPAVALMPDVTPKPLRSQANAMINLAGGAGSAIAFLIYTIVLNINPSGYVAIFGFVALSMVILLVLFLILNNENKLRKECELQCAEYGITDNDEEDKKDDSALLSGTAQEVKKKKRARFISFLLILASIFMWFMGYNAVTSNLSIYITKTLGLTSGLGAIISGISMGISAIAFIPVGVLATKIGRRKSVMLGFGMAIVSFVLIFFFAGNPSSYAMYLFTVFYLIAGFGQIIGNVNTFPMVVELSSNENIGKYTGFYYTATMSAQAITPMIAGAIMDKFGNKYMFLYSIICIAISVLIMLFVRHGDSKAPPKSKLEMLGEDA